MPEAVPHEALARAVRSAFGAAARVSHVTPLAGDASSRRYFRLALTGVEAPACVVAMLLAGDRPALTSEELGGAPLAQHELPYVNVGRYLAARGLPVPMTYLDASARDGLLLIEDVGDTTLWAAASADPARTEDLFGAAIDTLVALQVAGARHPDPSCQAFALRFDARLARAELEHFVEHGIETRRGARLPVAERTALLAALAPIVAPFEHGPFALAHRDFMAWNLHLQAGRLRLIDFQDALLAPDTYDLAALLTDRTTGTLIPPPLEEALIRRFVAAREAAGMPAGGDVTLRYRLCALHRALKVIGRFYFLERVKGKPGYLAYLPAVYDVARQMLASLPSVAELMPLLAAQVPELARGVEP
jgi:aminoglycoside/choline kinase family phosphotransferase